MSDLILVTPAISLKRSELKFTTLRSSGPGGQNINKVSTAVQLRFDVVHSNLPPPIKSRLLKSAGNLATNGGEIIIEAKRFRSQPKNKNDAMDRLISLLRKAAHERKPRKRTKPTQTSTGKRLFSKKKRGILKKLRQSRDLE